MQEKAVAIVPGDIFGNFSADRLRMSYATEIELIKEAMNRLEEFIDRIK